MQGSKDFFGLLFIFMFRIFLSYETKHQNLFSVCVHFICVLTADQPSFNEHLSILQQADSILLALCSFNGGFL